MYKTSKLKKSKFSVVIRKMLVTFMSLAFFYLVIGDLITYHQKAIFNFDAFAGQPINKPDKSDKGSLYKLKDKKDRVLAKFLTFVSEHNDVQVGFIPESFVIVDASCIVYLLVFQPSSAVDFRGPPTL